MLPKTGWGNICWVTYPAYVLSGTVLKSLVLLVPVTLRSGRSKSSLKSAILRIPTEIDFEGFSRSKRYSWFQMTSLPLRPVQPLAKSDRRSRDNDDRWTINVPWSPVRFSVYRLFCTFQIHLFSWTYMLFSCRPINF